MTPHPRGVWVDPYVHLALIEYAWLKRTTMSDVLRSVLEYIVEHPDDDSYLAVPDRPGRKRLAAKTSDEQWEAAAAVALAHGVGFHSLVRRHIIKVLKEEGLIE